MTEMAEMTTMAMMATMTTMATMADDLAKLMYMRVANLAIVGCVRFLFLRE